MRGPKVCTFVIKVINAVILIFRCATIKGITKANRSPLLWVLGIRGLRAEGKLNVPTRIRIRTRV